MNDHWIVYDQRAILGPPENAVVLAVATSRQEAIRDCRDQGGGCVHTPEGDLTFWLDGGREWNATQMNDQ